uniref:B30.2/SPRY domain-containing protein n=1 Tax=Monodelphis domestica TaxID=13616 RepID=A0A5F8HHG7_MONDO
MYSCARCPPPCFSLTIFAAPLKEKSEPVNNQSHLPQISLKPRVATTYDTGSPYRFFLLKQNDKSVISYSRQPKGGGDMDVLTYVLGQERFDSGKHYWEVNVEGKKEWALGLCKDSVCNEEEADVTPETGFWIICLVNGDTYRAFSRHWIQLQLAVAPKTVRIFLDYETGTIAFSNAADSSHIHTFHDTFEEALRPCSSSGPFREVENHNLLHPLESISERMKKFK